MDRSVICDKAGSDGECEYCYHGRPHVVKPACATVLCGAIGDFAACVDIDSEIWGEQREESGETRES
jgi:hypothetical protein